MSAFFGPPQSWLGRNLIRVVSIQLLLSYLPLVTCPYAIPDLNEPAVVEWNLNEPAVAEWNEMAEKQPLVVEPRPVSIGTHEDAVNSESYADQGQSSSVRASEETGGPTEDIVPEPKPSELMPVDFLSTPEIKIWERKVRNKVKKSEFPDHVLMSLGVGGYNAFRERHFEYPNVKNYQRLLTLDLAGEVMGNIELQSLGLVKDKEALLLDLERVWFGPRPQQGWTRRPRNVLLAVDHGMTVVMYHIRLLNHLYRPSILKKESELKEVQRKSFRSLARILRLVNGMSSQRNAQPPIAISGGPARRIASLLRRFDEISKGQRLAFAWRATEFVIKTHLPDLYKIFPREKNEVHRFLKLCIGDQTIASASKLPQTKIPKKDQIIITKDFFMTSERKLPQTRIPKKARTIITKDFS